MREVHEALAKDSGYTTTLKLMQLMFEKGLVVRNERYRSHLYEARAPKEQTQRQIAGDLMKRAFDGSAKSLVLGALATGRHDSAFARRRQPRSVPRLLPPRGSVSCRDC